MRRNVPIRVAPAPSDKDAIRQWATGLGSDPLPLEERSGYGRGFPLKQEMSRRSDVTRRRSIVTEEHVIS